MAKTRRAPGEPIHHADLARLVPDITDARAAAIEACGATPPQLEEAIAWAAGESDVMGGELERPLDGPVAALYDILTADEAFEGDRD